MVALLEEYKPHREKLDTPSKNRSTEIFSTTHGNTRFFDSQVVDLHQENEGCGYETASGVRYYGFRWYDSANGRWPSKDPLGDQAFFINYVRNNPGSDIRNLRDQTLGNLYGFVQNNPINAIDLLGLECCKDKCKKWTIRFESQLALTIGFGVAIMKADLIPDGSCDIKYSSREPLLIQGRQYIFTAFAVGAGIKVSASFSTSEFKIDSDRCLEYKDFEGVGSFKSIGAALWFGGGEFEFTTPVSSHSTGLTWTDATLDFSIAGGIGKWDVTGI